MNYNDSTRTGKPHPNDGTAMRKYSQTYAYDEVGNLLEVVHTPSSGTGWTRTYTIDSASNRLDENSIGSNAVTAESYTYDARGNIITGFNHLTSLIYNEDNRLEKVVLADTNITSYYQYDGSGQRVRKVTKDNHSNGYKQVRKYVGSWEVYEKIDSNNDVVSQRETLHIMDDRARVALIDTPVIAESNTEVQLLRYQFSNHLQTATLELDKVAAIISYEEYYPFGSTSFQSGRNATEVSRKRYRYTGKEKDEETGLYYHGARYYAPWICRWIAADPINSESYNHSKGQPAKNHERDFVELTASSYEYCYDNPVRFNDPEGEQPPEQKLEELQNKPGACVKIPIEEAKEKEKEKLSPKTKDLSLSQEGVEFVKAAEGSRLKVYDANTGKNAQYDKKGGLIKVKNADWTIGYGHKLTSDEIKNNTFKDGIKEDKATSLLKKDNVPTFEKAVNKLLTVQVNQNQFNALVSFAFQQGQNSQSLKDVIKLVNQSELDKAATKIEKTGHKTSRRMAESKMFSEGSYLPPSDYLPKKTVVLKSIKSAVHKTKK